MEIHPFRIASMIFRGAVAVFTFTADQRNQTIDIMEKK